MFYYIFHLVCLEKALAILHNYVLDVLIVCGSKTLVFRSQNIRLHLSNRCRCSADLGFISMEKLSRSVALSRNSATSLSSQ